jgi:hypothetical protein
MRLRPRWALVDDLRRFVQSFCACARMSPDRDAQLALAVHELVQNAIPLARGEAVELELELDEAGGTATISVTNPCDDARYESLRARIARMNAEPDALRHYVDTMRATPAAERGGLGLARVRYEAQLDLSLRRTPGRVTVVAQGSLFAAPRAPPELP